VRKGEGIMAADCVRQSVNILPTLLFIASVSTICLGADSVELGGSCTEDRSSTNALDFASWKQEVERVVYPAAIGKSLEEVLGDNSESLLVGGGGLIPWGVHSYRWGKRIEIRSAATCVMTLSALDEETGKRTLLSYSDAAGGLDIVQRGIVDSIWIGAKSWQKLSGEPFDLSSVDSAFRQDGEEGDLKWFSRTDLHGSLSVCENGLFFYYRSPDSYPINLDEADIQEWMHARQSERDSESDSPSPVYIGIIDVEAFRRYLGMMSDDQPG